jgi:hypothetical protein
VHIHAHEWFCDRANTVRREKLASPMAASLQ